MVPNLCYLILESKGCMASLSPVGVTIVHIRNMATYNFLLAKAMPNASATFMNTNFFTWIAIMVLDFPKFV